MADFSGPSQPGGADQPGWRCRLAVGHVAVVKGQLTGLEVAADQQVVPGGGGGEPRPGVPALALGARPGGADLPAAPARQQGGGLRAGQLDAAGQHEAEVRRHPQHVGLVVVFEVLAQLGAVAVDLVAADEVQPDAVGDGLGEDVDGQLPLGAEGQVQRQAHDRRCHRVVDVRGRDPLPGADQRVPGAFPHVRQVHGVDPVGHLARAAQVLPLHPGGAAARLVLPGLVDRADHQAAAPAGLARGLIQPGHREPAHHPHRREGVPDCPVEQPLRPVRRPVPRMLGDRPPVPSAQLAHHCGGVLARLQPRLCPREARPQQLQQLSPFPAAQRGAYPGGSSRLRFCCRHTRMIGRRLRSAKRFPP